MESSLAIKPYVAHLDYCEQHGNPRSPLAARACHAARSATSSLLRRKEKRGILRLHVEKGHAGIGLPLHVGARKPRRTSCARGLFVSGPRSDSMVGRFGAPSGAPLPTGGKTNPLRPAAIRDWSLAGWPTSFVGVSS